MEKKEILPIELENVDEKIISKYEEHKKNPEDSIIVNELIEHFQENENWLNVVKLYKYLANACNYQTTTHLAHTSSMLLCPKYLPTSRYNLFTTQVFVRAHFDYDPEKDSMIPCRDAGLPFKNGDVLQIVEQDDPNWWQVSNLKSNYL